jgi:hypothetical protein
MKIGHRSRRRLLKGSACAEKRFFCSSRQRQHCTHASMGSADRSADRACFGFEAWLLFGFEAQNNNNNNNNNSSRDVSRIIDADNRRNLLLFNAGAHYVDNQCGADSVRACQFRDFNAILTAFSVGTHR